MRKLTLAATLFAVLIACGKKQDAPKQEAPKVVDKQPTEKPPEPPAAAKADITITTKSAEARAEFEKGSEALWNARFADAIPHLEKAIQLDPEFALAHAWLGQLSPGPEGTELLHKAGTLAAKLPEAEREWITALQAQRAGDATKARAALERASELAPGSVRIALVLGQLNLDTRNHAAAVAAFERALALKPDLAIAYNGIAYVRADEKKWDEAIAAAKKQVELLPKEPNPLDTLADIQMWSGKVEDAEKSFVAAAGLDPKFTLAWQGAAIARGYRGDYKAAHEALQKQLAGASEQEKHDPHIDMAWIAMADDKPADALKHLDDIEKDPAAKQHPAYAFAQLARGFVMMDTGKYAEASKALATARTRAEDLAGDGRRNLKRAHALAVLRVAALTGKPAAETDKMLATIEDDIKANPDDKNLLSGADYARGLIAWAKPNGVKPAIVELSKCPDDLVRCRYDLYLAQVKAGDTASADATKKQILSTPRRDSGTVFIHSRLKKMP